MRSRIGMRRKHFGIVRKSKKALQLFVVKVINSNSTMIVSEAVMAHPVKHLLDLSIRKAEILEIDKSRRFERCEELIRSVLFRRSI